jgi:hypothetical protein
MKKGSIPLLANCSNIDLDTSMSFSRGVDRAMNYRILKEAPAVTFFTAMVTLFSLGGVWNPVVEILSRREYLIPETGARPTSHERCVRFTVRSLAAHGTFYYIKNTFRRYVT